MGLEILVKLQFLFMTGLWDLTTGLGNDPVHWRWTWDPSQYFAVQCVLDIWCTALSSVNAPYKRKKRQKNIYQNIWKLIENLIILPTWVILRGLSAWGIQNWSICSLLSQFCSPNFWNFERIAGENKPYIQNLDHISKIFYCIESHSVRDQQKLNHIAEKTIYLRPI